MLLDMEIDDCVSKEVLSCSIPNTSGTPEAALSEDICLIPATGPAQRFQAPDSRNSEDEGATQNYQTFCYQGNSGWQAYDIKGPCELQELKSRRCGFFL